MRRIIFFALVAVLAACYNFYYPVSIHAEESAGNVEQSTTSYFDLGTMYYLGDKVPKDYAEAAMYFRLAAEQGHNGAQFVLGEFYFNGRGVEQNYAEALKWWSASANQGNVWAQYNLGVMYETGQGVTQNLTEAARWYRSAAEQGKAEAQHNLGLIFSNGRGVEQNLTEAAKWFGMAAEQGIAKSQYELGLLYLGGEGVPQFFQGAFKLFQKASEQGHAGAQANLGTMLAWGMGVPKDPITGYAWLNLSASQGNIVASSVLVEESKKLTPLQLAEAQKLSVQLQQQILQRSTGVVQSDLPPQTFESSDRQLKGSGSGFIITKDGYVMTCQHVIDGAQSVEVALDGNIYPGKIIREDKYNDLALLKISGTFPPLAFSLKRSAQMGQDVFTIGYPNPTIQGFSAKLTKGTVASLSGFQDDLRLYQISVPVQPGNSGGPLLDVNGNIMGIIVAILDAKSAFDITGSLPQNVNYAVKGAYAQALLDTLPEVSKKIPPPFQEQSLTDVAARVNKSVVMILTY